MPDALRCVFFFKSEKLVRLLNPISLVFSRGQCNQDAIKFAILAIFRIQIETKILLFATWAPI